ncbi:MAG TPA: enoyl-CoA hydratase-related protein [Mycobacteriales bacterium]|nr:enoyl-CoA hydratase-related protein [Mycobacteriales bacterium]
MQNRIADALGEAAPLLAVDVRDGIATVRLTRPDKHNAVSFAMWHALGRLMPVLAEDDDVDVVVLRGTPGGPFSAGADIAEFTALRSDPEGARRYGDAVEAGEQALIRFPKPTIAMVEGFAIGGGTQLAVACDLRVCETGSRFGVTPAKLGIVYALGSTARLVEVVGPAWARWILLTGDLVDAGTALRIGLVHEVVAPGEVEARVYALARTLASRARISLVGGKAMVARAVEGRLDEDDEVVALYEQSWRSAEYAEGVQAFLSKRPPDFAAARGRGA